LYLIILDSKCKGFDVFLEVILAYGIYLKGFQVMHNFQGFIEEIAFIFADYVSQMSLVWISRITKG
jgi:hypothetical protein